MAQRKLKTKKMNASQADYGIRTTGKMAYPGKIVKGAVRGGTTKRKSR